MFGRHASEYKYDNTPIHQLFAELVFSPDASGTLRERGGEKYLKSLLSEPDAIQALCAAVSIYPISVSKLILDTLTSAGLADVILQVNPDDKHSKKEKCFLRFLLAIQSADESEHLYGLSDEQRALVIDALRPEDLQRLIFHTFDLQVLLGFLPPERWQDMLRELGGEFIVNIMHSGTGLAEHVLQFLPEEHRADFLTQEIAQKRLQQVVTRKDVISGGNEIGRILAVLPESARVLVLRNYIGQQTVQAVAKRIVDVVSMAVQLPIMERWPFIRDAIGMERLKQLVADGYDLVSFLKVLPGATMLMALNSLQLPPAELRDMFKGKTHLQSLHGLLTPVFEEGRDRLGMEHASGPQEGMYSPRFVFGSNDSSQQDGSASIDHAAHLQRKLLKKRR